MPRLLALIVLATCTTTVLADWPQWLGPTRNGVSTEVVKPWKGQLKVLWQKPVGEGHGSPVVADGRVYLHVRKAGVAEEEVLAFDAATGKPLWNTGYAIAPTQTLFGNGPRDTPTVAQGKVYAFGLTGVLTCFDASKGDLLWKVDTIKEFNAPKLFFGASCSPLVEGGRVLVNVGAKGASIVAFDPGKGDVLWKALDDRASYASPIATGKGNSRQVLFLTHQGVVSVSPTDGKLFWRYPFVDKLAESSTTPVVMNNLLIASSITLGSVGLKLESGAKAEKLWFNEDLTSYFSTPVPADQQLYMVTGTKPPAVVTKADLHCLDPQTGKTLWTRPKVGQYHASLLRTGDGKLLLLEEQGNLVLLQPNPSEYRELCRSRICGNTWAHPALSQGRLYIRDNGNLICVELP